MWDVSDFAWHKQLAEPVIDCYRAIRWNTNADLIQHCGDHLTFCEDPETGKSLLLTADFCKDRFCPMCNGRRGFKLLSKIEDVVNQKVTSGDKFVFVTFTVQNVSALDLGDSISKLQQSITSSLNCADFKQSSYFRSLEVTLNNRQFLSDGSKNPWYLTFHPHFHMLYRLDERTRDWDINRLAKRFFERWQIGLSKYYPGAVIDRRAFDCHFVESSQDDLYSAILEVTKYCIKSSLTAAQLLRAGHPEYMEHLASALKNRRLFVACGDFRFSSLLDDDLIHIDNSDCLNFHLVQLFQFRFYHWDQVSHEYRGSDSFPSLLLERKGLQKRFIRFLKRYREDAYEILSG